MKQSSPADLSAAGLTGGNTLPPACSPGKKRSRRLRKKLRVGEFQELGFETQVKLTGSYTPEEQESLVEALLLGVIEPRSLSFTGWLKGGFVAHRGRVSATEDDRESVRQWLLSRPEVESVVIGPLIDAWYLAEAS